MLNARSTAVLAAAAVSLFAAGAQALPVRMSGSAGEALARLRSNTAGSLLYERDANAAYVRLRADSAAPLFADEASGAPADRAHYFLSLYGAAIGVTDPAQDTVLQRVSHDAAGNTHVHLDQLHGGLPVFGARLVVHMNGAGITGVSGVFVPDLDALSVTPKLAVTQLQAAAIAALSKLHPGAQLHVDSGRWVVYPDGLIQGQLHQSYLVYQAQVLGDEQHVVRSQVFVDGNSGLVLNRIDGIQAKLNRMIYTPDLTAPPTYTEGSVGTPADIPLINDPGHNGTVASARSSRPPVDNLYIFAGGTYALYKNMFGREGYDDCDGAGTCKTAAQQVQKSVYLVNDACPNAYWDGVSTNYCPGFDADDVVSHEWSHAYTEYTHSLIYQYQPGALNESFSDIFGETYDLVNKIEGPLGASLTEHKYYEENGTRWVVGEDLSDAASQLLLRDMWKPDDFPSANPGKVSSTNYDCAGEVHFNSSISNHAYAMLVDGTTGQGPVGSTGAARNTYNGQTFAGIGIVKAAHIYFQAESHYQTPTTSFSEHADALESSCQDLLGADLKDPTGAVSTQKITAADCAIVHKDMLATEMRLAPGCVYKPLLQPESSTPALCGSDTPNTVLTENWEGGTIPAGWTLTSTGVSAASWDNVNWTVSSSLPAPHVGKAAFALDATNGDCAADDNSGHFSMDSPNVTLPNGGNRLSFTHYVASEKGFDGGNLKYSRNNGAFAIVPPAAFVYNGHSGKFGAAAPVGNNTSPLAGEAAWTGTDEGETHGSWGTTIVDIGKLGAVAGDKIKFRWDFGQDGCGGVVGWFVDNVSFLSCPVSLPPVLSLGPDYENPDVNGSYTLNWTHPAGAIGPDLLQASTVSCAAAFSDDAESGLGKWVATNDDPQFAPAWTTSASKPLPSHAGTAFWASANSEVVFGTAWLTLKNPIAIPAGAGATLKFSDWYMNEPEDIGSVEVTKDNGTTWTEIYRTTRADSSEVAAQEFAQEDVSPHTLDLSPFAGNSIKVRFQMYIGGSEYYFYTQYGWYVDDVSITIDSWNDLPTPSGTSQLITNQPNGTACYRVRTNYLSNGQNAVSPFSNVVNARVNINLPPIAIAGEDFDAFEGDTATLDGSTSSDPDGETLSYLWEQVSGPAVTLTGANKAKATFTVPSVCANTPLVFKLTVTTPTGTASDTVNFTALNHNTAPTPRAGGDDSVTEGAGYLLSAATSSDPDCEALQYSWAQVEGPTAALANADTATPSFTAPPVDEDTPLVFRLTVTDAAGASASDDVTIVDLDSVRPAGTPAIGNNAAGMLSPLGVLLLGVAGLARRRRLRH